MTNSENATLPAETPNVYANCLQGLAPHLIVRSQLVEWLRELPRGTRFGVDSDDCVIARYTGLMTGFVSCGGGDLPEWVTEFIRNFCEGRSRSPRAALKLLGEMA